MPEAGSGTSRNRGVGRRPEEEVIERRRPGRAQASDLLARFGRSAERAGPAPDTGLAATSRDAEAAAAAAPPGVGEVAVGIAARAARFLAGSTPDAETDLFDAGLSSVDAVELLAVMARELDVRVSLDDFFADARPRRLAQRWAEAAGLPTAVVPDSSAETPSADASSPTAASANPAPVVVPAASAAPPATGQASPAIAPVVVRGSAGTADEDLETILSDLALADRLPFSRQAEPVVPRRILLTGATGYLGSHLLLDLLRQADAHVVCLVRAADDDAAERRLADALRSFEQPWSSEVRRRVTVLAADLRRPHLGLSGERWAALAQEIDSIVNVAAAVDFLRGYPSLRQTNVLGPLALAELAMTGRPKPLHHVSSVAVFNEVGIEKMGEDDPVAHIDRLFAGYDKSKWAAEAVLRRAREHGLSVTILRPGAIAGHTRTGVYNPRDLSTGLIGAFSRYRTVPAFRSMNLAPVDWISKVMAAVVFDPSAWGQNYHLTGRAETLPELVNDMKLAGMNVGVADWRDWRDDLIQRHTAEPVPELDFLIRILRSPTAMKLFEALMLGPEAGMERTERFVHRHRLPMPERYGAQAQLKAFERMAENGVARLPSPEDAPYLSFRERTKGHVGPIGEDRDTRCRMALTLSIASMYQVVRHRRIDVRGEVACERLHREPLRVETGEIWVRPDEGVPLRHGGDHPLLRYRMVLVDRDHGRWWLEGWKTARAGRDFWKQTRTIEVTIGREGEPASLAGVVRVPGKSFVPDQIDGIRVDPRLSSQEQRLAKLTWLSWFFVQVGIGLAEPSLRMAAELLDLRRDAIDRDKDRLQHKIRKLMIKREQTR
ncbi:thioester reductase domain-containing protein [Actinacidiphila paucisporea]|uniref:Thioester reductase domain-containing protein n=1 Tax=Actinacidiphila paucisporea TaxID=310782 RepID=A0A1M7LST6_9ACTN|nr:thioester reductase domain-containing protein [Actinacidiphila paucisporea]SHM81362.1 thioester reductase domain-containing protein [Actinacidiphila paucisporea]